MEDKIEMIRQILSDIAKVSEVRKNEVNLAPEITVDFVHREAVRALSLLKSIHS